MKATALVFYGIFGTLGVVLGVAALLMPSLALPREAYTPLTAHLIREQGAEGVFIGLMAFWCLFHFDERRPVHYALLAFTSLFAVIHWSDYFHGRLRLASPVINSIPFLLLLMTAPLSRPRAEPKSPRPAT